MPPALRDALIDFACAVLPPLGGWLAWELRSHTKASDAHTAALNAHGEALRANTSALRGPAVERQLHQQHKAKP